MREEALGSLADERRVGKTKLLPTLRACEETSCLRADGTNKHVLELPAATTSTTPTPGVGACFDIRTSGAALLTNRRLVGVVVESLEEAGADLVTALAHLNSNHRHLRHCPRVQQ